MFKSRVRAVKRLLMIRVCAVDQLSTFLFFFLRRREKAVWHVSVRKTAAELGKHLAGASKKLHTLHIQG